MRVFGLPILAAIACYLIGLFGGMFVVETFSSNVHDKSMGADMTGAFFLRATDGVGGRHCYDRLLPPPAKAAVLISRSPIAMESTDPSLQPALVFRRNAADQLHRRGVVGYEAMLFIRGDVD